MGAPEGDRKARSTRVTPTSSTSPGAAGFIYPIETQSWRKSTTYGSLRGRDQKTRIGGREEQTPFLIVLMRSAISSPGVLARICFVSVIWDMEGRAFWPQGLCICGSCPAWDVSQYPQLQLLFLQVSAPISSPQRGISDHIILNPSLFLFILLALELLALYLFGNQLY